MTEQLINDELNKILSGNYDNETIVFLLGGEEDDRVLNRLLLSLRQQVIDKDAKIQRIGKRVLNLETGMKEVRDLLVHVFETHHDTVEEVVPCVCCGIDERDIYKYRVVDGSPNPNKEV
jgi:hypothetical protein